MSEAQREKPILLGPHAARQLRQRGADEKQVVEAIRNERWERAKLGRLECRRNFPFNSVWKGREYQTQQVRPIFVDEPGAIVIVTVYVFYF